jgi:peptidoglycan hydrolase FlgJ
MTVAPLSAVSAAPASRAADGIQASPASSARAAGKEFEAMFVTRMMESMFDGVKTGGLFGGGEAEKQWRGFLMQEYGKSIAEQGSLGIGRMVEADVARLYAAQAEGAGE